MSLNTGDLSILSFYANRPMMSFKELRIGNIISLGNRDAKIAWFDSGDMLTVYDLEETQDTLESIDRLKPILLTEEWLVKLGAHKGDEGRSGEKGHYQMYFLPKTNYSAFYYWTRKDVYCFGFDVFLNTPIKYVHQLQNLYFALTNKELIIKP